MIFSGNASDFQRPVIRRAAAALSFAAFVLVAGCGGGGGGHTSGGTDTGGTGGGAAQHAFNAYDAGEGSPAFNWTYQVNATTAIPFVEYGFKVRGNGATGATSERVLPDPVCYALHVMQKFNFSPGIAQGTTVGRITVTLTDGTEIGTDLVAGVNTADFAYDKYVAQGIVPAHQKPATPYAQPTTEDGINYNIRHFYLRFNTADATGAPRAVHKIKVEAYLDGKPADFGVDLYGLTLEQAPAG